MFLCKQCGKCCKLMYHLPNDNKWRKLLDRGDGICKYLTETNICSIYLHRPHICNHKWVYKNKLKNVITYEEFEQILNRACKKIREMR